LWQIIFSSLDKFSLSNKTLTSITNFLKIYITLLLHFYFEFINKSFQVKAVILLIEAHSKLNLEKIGK